MRKVHLSWEDGLVWKPVRASSEVKNWPITCGLLRLRTQEPPASEGVMQPELSGAVLLSYAGG